MVKTISQRKAENLSQNKMDLRPSFPAKIMLELSNACQYNCRFCAHDTTIIPQKFLPLEVGYKFLKEAFAEGAEEVGLNGCGEQFLHKDVAQFIGYAKKIGYEYIYATSNGASPLERYLRAIDNGLDSLKISFNAVRPDDYSAVHGTSQNTFDRVAENIRKIGDYIIKNSYSCMLSISSVLPERGMSEERKTEYHNRLQELFPQNLREILLYEPHSQAGQSTENLKGIENPKYYCFEVFNRIRLTSGARVSLCCVDFNDNIAVGEYTEGQLKNLWNSDLSMFLRKKFIEKNLEGTLCHQCVTCVPHHFMTLEKLYEQEAEYNRLG